MATRCEWCDKPVPSRRKDMQGVAKDFCTNRCLVRKAENLVNPNGPGIVSDLFSKLKMPKYTPKVAPPGKNADPWSFIAWATMEFVAKAAEIHGNEALDDLEEQVTDADIPGDHGFSAKGVWEAYQQHAANAREASNRVVPQPLSERETLLKELGLGKTATLIEAEHAYRVKAKICHPDVSGGSDVAMKQLNGTIQKLREILGG